MNKPLLSICIPTYNRVHYLKECLDCIVCQFKDKKVYNQVEMVISDNASKDDTQKLVEEYQKDFSNIRYFRNSDNLGFDRNVDSVITKSGGNFCWTMSDDDIMKKSALSFILDVIKRYPEISYIGINPANASDKEEIRYYKSGKEFISSKALLPPDGLLSHCIINKKFLPRDRKKYYGNYWFHYSLVLEIIASRSFVVVKSILEEVERESRLEVGGANFLTYVYLKNIIKNLSRFGYKKKSINRLLKGFTRGAPKNVASAKIHGLKTNFSNFKLLIKEFFYSPFWLLVSILVFFTPIFILKKVKKFKSK